MIDPLGTLLTEIRDNAAVAALTTRIRGGEPAPGDAALPFGRFVVLVRLGSQRHKRAPVQEVRIALRCYGTSYADAAALYGAVSDAIHNVGPRIGATGVLIHRSFDDIGMGAERDPATGQPHEDGVISLFAATSAVTA
ncbi:MAG TPA: DUF3168 domain-containing protein [Patescibacteria group bacterium]|nr:DUF3168 domain-containing protein [Patescibacteria group bacterium]